MQRGDSVGIIPSFVLRPVCRTWFDPQHGQLMHNNLHGRLSRTLALKVGLEESSSLGRPDE